MNPYALILLLVGITLIVIAWKGSQDNVLSALLNRPYGNSTLG